MVVSQQRDHDLQMLVTGSSRRQVRLEVSPVLGDRRMGVNVSSHRVWVYRNEQRPAVVPLAGLLPGMYAVQVYSLPLQKLVHVGPFVEVVADDVDSDADTHWTDAESGGSHELEEKPEYASSQKDAVEAIQDQDTDLNELFADPDTILDVLQEDDSKEQDLAMEFLRLALSPEAPQPEFIHRMMARKLLQVNGQILAMFVQTCNVPLMTSYLDYVRDTMTHSDAATHAFASALMASGLHCHGLVDVIVEDDAKMLTPLYRGELIKVLVNREQLDDLDRLSDRIHRLLQHEIDFSVINAEQWFMISEYPSILSMIRPYAWNDSRVDRRGLQAALDAAGMSHGSVSMSDEDDDASFTSANKYF
jgi:hypothetical protein